MSTYLYRLYDDASQLLYIGISNSVARRWIQHLTSKPWAHEVARMERGDVFETRSAALEAERFAIMRQGPRYNITHNEYRDQVLPKLTSDEQLDYAAPFILFALEDLGEGTWDELADYVENNSPLFDRTLMHLIRTACITVDARGCFALTDTGRARISELESA